MVKNKKNVVTTSSLVRKFKIPRPQQQKLVRDPAAAAAAAAEEKEERTTSSCFGCGYCKFPVENFGNLQQKKETKEEAAAVCGDHHPLRTIEACRRCGKVFHKDCLAVDRCCFAFSYADLYRWFELKFAECRMSPSSSSLLLFVEHCTQCLDAGELADMILETTTYFPAETNPLVLGGTEPTRDVVVICRVLLSRLLTAETPAAAAAAAAVAEWADIVRVLGDIARDLFFRRIRRSGMRNLKEQLLSATTSSYYKNNLKIGETDERKVALFFLLATDKEILKQTKLCQEILLRIDNEMARRLRSGGGGGDAILVAGNEFILTKQIMCETCLRPVRKRGLALICGGTDRRQRTKSADKNHDDDHHHSPLPPQPLLPPPSTLCHAVYCVTCIRNTVTQYAGTGEKTIICCQRCDEPFYNQSINDTGVLKYVKCQSINSHQLFSKPMQVGR